MLTTRVEISRLLHQDLEILETGIVRDLTTEVKTVKDRVLQEHKAAVQLDEYVETAKKLLLEYDDTEGIRKAELIDMSGDGVFTSFYDRLKAIREHHRNHPSQPSIPDRHEVKPKVAFSGIENYGKFLDMHSLFERYVNMLVFGKNHIDYLSFLAKFDKLHLVKKADKLKYFNEYKQWILDTSDYLFTFFRRINPLFDVEKILPTIQEDFDSAWEAQNIPGWMGSRVDWSEGGSSSSTSTSAAAATASAGAAAAAAAAASTSTATASTGEGGGSSSSEGGDAKMEDGERERERESKDDESNPLYCVACQKAFKKQTVFDHHLKGKQHIKNKTNLSKDDEKSKVKAVQNRTRELAQTEHKIARLCEILRPQLEATRDFVEKTFTRTPEEIAAEMEAEEHAVVEEQQTQEEEEEGEQPIYNPLNLPLGWDGKPIPYWLYKLHGLNIEYKCEICGGYSYWGPRAYEKHFKEWRHSYGMRCLGIPNTKEFLNITKFEEALTLWRKMQEFDVTQTWRPEDHEEFEDKDGNVFNKKTYDDLRRQGII